MSVQEHHEKKGSICQIKSTTKGRINMSIQEHHERKDKYVKSRAPRKKGSICQFDQHIKSNVSQPSHICVIANHINCNIRSNKSTTKTIVEGIQILPKREG